MMLLARLATGTFSQDKDSPADILPAKKMCASAKPGTVPSPTSAVGATIMLFLIRAIVLLLYSSA